VNASPSVRTIPPDIQRKYDAWKSWASVWNTVHYTAGSGAAALSAVSAANSKVQFLTGGQPLWIAIAAAICAFVLTTLSPQKTAKGFINAYRHLEKAMACYRLDPAVDVTSLGKAEAEGVDLLD
jgi:sugar phosphate permease